jgi:hypothetical protein
VSKSKQDALKKAQQYISGKRLERSEVKTLEQKGFTSDQIRAVAGSMASVGDKAQSRIDDRHDSGGKGTPGKVRTVGTGVDLRVNKDGEAIATEDNWAKYIKNPYLIVNQKQADKINRKVENVGGSLYGGKGMALSRFVTVKDPGGYITDDSGDMTGTGRTTFWSGAQSTPSGKQQIAIYTPIKGRRGSSGGDSGKGAPSSSIAPSTQDRPYRQAYQRAQDHISGRTRQGQAPTLTITPGNGIQDVANFANSLGAYNANYSGWMQDRAEAGRSLTGSWLQSFAGITPKAPDVLTGDDLIKMANQMNKGIKVG